MVRYTMKVASKAINDTTQLNIIYWLICLASELPVVSRYSFFREKIKSAFTLVDLAAYIPVHVYRRPEDSFRGFSGTPKELA